MKFQEKYKKTEREQEDKVTQLQPTAAAAEISVDAAGAQDSPELHRNGSFPHGILRCRAAKSHQIKTGKQNCPEFGTLHHYLHSLSHPQMRSAPGYLHYVGEAPLRPEARDVGGSYCRCNFSEVAQQSAVDDDTLARVQPITAAADGDRAA